MEMNDNSVWRCVLLVRMEGGSGKVELCPLFSNLGLGGGKGSVLVRVGVSGCAATSVQVVAPPSE